MSRTCCIAQRRWAATKSIIPILTIVLVIICPRAFSQGIPLSGQYGGVELSGPTAGAAVRAGTCGTGVVPIMGKRVPYISPNTAVQSQASFIRTARVEPLVLRKGIDTHRLLLTVDPSVRIIKLKNAGSILRDGSRLSWIPMYDDGTNGDAVAGDKTFTVDKLTLDVPAVPASPVFHTSTTVDSATIEYSDGRTATESIYLSLDFASIDAAVVPLVAIEPLAGDARKTDYVVNIDVGSDPGSIDNFAVARRYYAVVGEEKDFLFIEDPFTYNAPTYAGYHSFAGNSVSGIGIGRMDYTASYGSSGILKAVIRTLSMSLTPGLLNHELLHQWAVWIGMGLDLAVHWSAVERASSGFGSSWGAYARIEFESGRTYRGYLCQEGTIFNDLELYLMGLVGVSEVASPIRTVVNPTPGEYRWDPGEQSSYRVINGDGVRDVSMSDILSTHGPRIPDVTHSQKAYTAALIVVYDRPLTQVELSYYDFMMREYEKAVSQHLPASFQQATGGRATMSTRVVGGVVPPATNVVVNGGFESGATPWKYYHNGTGNAFSVVTTAPVPEGTHKARIALGSTIGSNNQLWQERITLEANTAYRLTFSHHASASTSFRVRLVEQDEDYTAYGFSFKYVYPTTGIQTYTLDFVTANFTGTVNDAMLQFYFVNAKASSIIYLDNITIAKRSGGPPTVATNLLFGTQPSNTMANAVITPAVTVRVVDTGGNLVTTETRDVTVDLGANPAAGTLGGVRTVAAVGGVATFTSLTINNPGIGYTLTATAANLTGATSTAFNITGITPPPANVVVNGGFEGGTSPWKYYHNGGAANAFSVVTTAPVPEGAHKAKIVLDGTIGTNNQLYQQNVALDAATAYRITFAHHASTSTSFRVRLIEQDEDLTPYGFSFKTVYPTTTVQTYALDFTTSGFQGTVTDAMLQFYFVNGTPSRTIYLDDVVVSRVGGGPPPVASKLAFGTHPSHTAAGTVITPAVTVRIEDPGGNLVTTDTRSVTVEIGSNPAGGTLSGTKTVAAVGGIATFSTLSVDNSGTGYTLTASASGLSGATSGAFNITAGPPPPAASVVLNGGFEAGTVPWKYYHNGGTSNSFSAVTTPPVPEGQYRAKIVLDATIGTNNQLYQTGMVMKANTAYRITFAHHASGTTSFRVRLIEQDDDYTVYGFSFKYVYPTTSAGIYALDFTTANFSGTVSDAMIQFYFVGGTPSRTIFLDNIVIAEKGGATAKEGAIGEASLTAPAEYSLLQNFPNPFNPSTTIRYGLPTDSRVTLTVFSMLGQHVATLVEGDQVSGYHEVQFDGSSFASGVYLYRFQVRPLDSANGRDSKGGAGDLVQTRKLVLVK